MATAAELRPTVDEVALIALRTRTVGHTPAYGGLGGDTGPEDVTTFTDSTRPTATEVEQIIDSAGDYVLARVDMPVEQVPVYQGGAIRHATALYTAVLIETSYFRETVNEGLLGVWQGLINGIVGAVTGTETGAAAHYSIGTIKVGTALTEAPVAEHPLNQDFMPGVDDEDPYDQPLVVALGRPAHNRARG